MASIPKLVEALPHVSDLYAVSLQHELKEILVVCRPVFADTPIFHAVQLLHQFEPRQIYGTSDQALTRANISPPLEYIFLPDASVLKTGLTDLLAHDMGYSKLHHFSHVLTGNKLIENKPGRCFKLKAVLPSEAKKIKAIIPEGKATLLLRDVLATQEQIRKKTGLREGGEQIVLATSIQKSEGILLWLEPLSN